VRSTAPKKWEGIKKMAFGRKWLDEILQNDDLTPKEKAQKIMDEHITVTNALKDERDSYKQEAEKAADIQKELDGIKGGEDFKKKYEDEHEAFENFKKQTAQDAETAKVKAAYRKLLSDEGISEKRLDSILKVTDLGKIKLDKDGNLEKLDDLKKAINDEWGEFKTTVTTKGADVEKPPQTGKGTMTKEEILKIQDTSARQKAIAENLNLFGKG